ncbi:MAG TPA: CHAD domain-containing protein [Caldimonas sp.]|nr:CHAD domain-containing protein [Caldimonas sp.]
MSEIELKFGIAPAAVAGVERALVRHGARSVGIESGYWDTPDRRLARADVSLRLRKAHGRWEQTVKAAGASPAERLEATVPRRAALAGVAPQPDLSLHAGTRAGHLVDKALARGNGAAAPLELVHTTRVRRRHLLVDAARSAIEVALDWGEIEAAGRSMPICEVEAELKHGDVADLIDFGRRSIDAHALWLSTIAKSTRGNRLASGSVQLASAVKATRPSFRAHADGSEVFRAAFRSCLEQVLANASIVASGAFDNDVVHQLRIGLRRMRTLWRELPDWRGTLASTWEAPAAQVFRSLGAYRDRRTVAAALRQPLADAGSPEPELRALPADAAVDPVAVVRSPAFQHALLDLLAFALARQDSSPRDDAPRAHVAGADDESPRAVTGRHLDKLHRRLARDAKRFVELSTLERHGVRKRLKRLRYLSELIASLYDKRPVARFLRALEPAQDELGHYIDLVVATRLARDRVDGGDARAWFNVGWLQAKEADAIKRCSAALRDVARAAPYW